jgi:hypothetical protein
MTWNKWVGIVTAAAFLAMAPTQAHARRADDVRGEVQKPERPQKPGFAKVEDKPKAEKPERPQKPGFAKVEDKPKAEKPERPQKPGFAKLETSHKPEKPARPEKPGLV